MIRTIYIILLFFFAGITRSDAQFDHSLGIGMNVAGYRLNNASIYAEYCFKNFSCNAEWIVNKSQGNGYSVSMNYYVIHKSIALNPFIGFACTRMWGVNKSYETSPDQFTVFSVGDGFYLIPLIGVRYNLIGEMDRSRYTRSGGLAFFVRAAYRFVVSNDPKVILLSGYPEAGRQNKLQNSINKGIGASAGFAFFIGKKKRK